MEMTKNYEPGSIEPGWYQHWMDKGYFKSIPDGREPYTITMPPPNVTGFLHMGHCLNGTIQDILIRHARMNGKNACWVPGMDHASIATEAKVVSMLREKGIKKSSLSRETFLEYAWEWKEKYGGIILEQLKKLGCSADWERTTFTLDQDYSQAVYQTFVDLYEKGLIYRGKRMIHWDVKAKTALSDEEVIYKETQSTLYYVQYKVDTTNEEYIQIATVRPETIPGDTAICVNPKDKRYTHLHGKYVFVPLIHRRIPIITDEYVEMDFGTGALKITPAHDINDYQIGLKHHLDIVEILNEDGTLNDAAEILIGEDRFDARKKIVALLEKENHIVKTEPYANQIGFSERTDAIIEPRLSMQWWVSMKKLADPALLPVLKNEINFYPSKYKNLYRHWMENIKDWCISRQLWWGHRIPAWYDDEGQIYVAENEEALFKKYPELKNKNLSRDEDVLDTWFSSWLWPMEVFKGISSPGNADFTYYYPTNTLVTAPEIIFFWVARMIMAGYAFENEKPFKDVYFTGIVRDKAGRKMSKSLGNSPDLLGLIDTYGADAVRFGIIVSSPAGNDLLFDESSLEQGRNFNNKIWNVVKLLKIWEAQNQPSDTKNIENFAIQWFKNRLLESKKNIADQMQHFQVSEALKTIYSLIWDDFCSWYIEWVKPAQGKSIEKYIVDQSMIFLDELMHILHPFMPFITEEIYHLVKERNEGDDLCIKQSENLIDPDILILQNGIALKKIITAMRDLRNKQSLKAKEEVRIFIKTENEKQFEPILSLLHKQLYATEISFIREPVKDALVLTIENDHFFITTSHIIHNESQREDLEKDLAYQRNFLASVLKKLQNEKFIQHAKAEVIALEQKKHDDAQARIEAIEASLKLL
ncbi:MAG: valine--tRNA ligase [Bacteroidetes bacterium]|nr:valine--tRNA ligase [Bacteroidota bacterium]